MNCARNCGNLLNFVKVIPKTSLVPFFSGHGVLLLPSSYHMASWRSGPSTEFSYRYENSGSNGKLSCFL